MNAERSGVIRTRGARADPRDAAFGSASGEARATRGDAERLLKNKYESFGVPRPSTLKGDRHTTRRRSRRAAAKTRGGAKGEDAGSDIHGSSETRRPRQG